MLNYVYEITTFCTSIIARTSEGYIIHGRNLDFYFPNETKAITYNAHFKRNNTIIFNATMFGGITGVFTGIKSGKFSISLNQRVKGDGLEGLLENIFKIMDGKQQSA